MDAASPVSHHSEPPRRFATTSWTLVVQAGSRKEAARPALEELCRSYWHPLVHFWNRHSFSRDQFRDAEDAVQSFFTWLIESNAIERADASRGRFRTFLLAAFKQFLARENEFWSAAKRCPDRPVISIEAAVETEKFNQGPFHELTAEKLFDYAWAMELIERTMSRLQAEWSSAGRAARFEALKGYLTGGETVKGRELAQRLDMTEGAVRVALHRLKQRFGEMLREEVAQTLSDAAEVDGELMHLLAVLRFG